MSYLEQYGRQLIAGGYSIIPLKPGSKHPTLTNWTNRDCKNEIDAWLDGPMRTWGVGILAKHNPAIDIDCDDPDVVRQVFRAVREIVGDCRAYRIGRAPRVLLVFRTDEPFKKLRSAKYEDLLERTNQVEILADGQQFAAYHIHPGTGKPYSWPAGGPAEILSDELPLLTRVHAEKIIEAFEQIAQEQVSMGKFWKVFENTSLATPQTTENWLISHKSAQHTEREKIVESLKLLSANDYDRWLQVGMILHHQFNGGNDGYQIWEDWSRTSQSFSSSDDCLYRWERFTSDTRASTVTVGSLFHWAEQARNEQAGNAILEVERLVAGCDSFGDLLGGRGAEYLRGWLDLYPLYRDRVVDLVKRRGRVLSGSPVSVETVRKALKSKGKKEKKDESIYPWAEPYVYAADEDRFFNLSSRVAWTRTAFDAAFNRLLVSEDGGPVSAARVALESAKIPHVEGVRYLPGAEPVFNLNGLPYANSYNPDEGAVVPMGMSPADLKARSMFARHLQTLIPDPDDCRTFIDFLTFVVQNPGKRLNFAIILRGVEGDGKSFFRGLMQLVLGPNNCSSVQGTYLEEKFTGWAEGSQLCFIEEIKMHGVSGYETMNKFKEYVTNDMVTIRKMHRVPYSAPNVTSYIMLTNYQDALPISVEDTRYYPIFSRWESQAEFQAWRDENPTFFHDLFDSVQASPGSIRKWFLERDISPGFDPSNRAPKGKGKALMAGYARDDLAEHIQDIIECKGGDYGKNEELVSSTWILWNWNFDGSGLSKPAGRRLNTIMRREGWLQVKVLKDEKTEIDRISINDRMHRLWTKNRMSTKIDNRWERSSKLLASVYSGEEPI